MATSSYTDTRLLINGEWCDAASGKTLDVINPATGQAIGKVAHAGIADLDRALEAAQRGFERLAQDSRQRARHHDAQSRRSGARARRRHRPPDDAGTGQAVRRSARRSAGRCGHHRMVRRRRPPRLWPDRAVAQPVGAATGAEGADRPGRGVHAVEFPGQPDRAQAERGAGKRLLVPRQGAGRNPGVAGCAAAGVRRSRRAGRHGRPRVRRSG